jgi:hypothetical protein
LLNENSVAKEDSNQISLYLMPNLQISPIRNFLLNPYVA